MKAWLAMAEGIYPIRDEHVQVHVEVQCGTEALDKGDGAAASTTVPG